MDSAKHDKHVVEADFSEPLPFSEEELALIEVHFATCIAMLAERHPAELET